MSNDLDPLHRAVASKSAAPGRARKAVARRAAPDLQSMFGNSVVAGLFTDESSLPEKPGGSAGRRHSGVVGAKRRTPLSEKPDLEAAQWTMTVAADVLQNSRARNFSALTGRPAEAIRILWAAMSGLEGTARLGADARRARLQQACVLLTPYLRVMMDDEAQRAWVEDQITPYLLKLTQSIDRLKAEERVSAAEKRVAAFARGDTSYLDQLESADLGTKKLFLHLKARDLIATTILINEQVLRLVHGSHDPKHMTKLNPTYQEQLEHVGQPPQLHGKTSRGVRALEDAQAILWELDALLTLTDPELTEELQKHHGLLGPMASITELVKAAVEILGGVVTLTFSFAAIVARFNGQIEWATLAGEWASRSLGKFADIIAGIEVVHGLVVLFSDAPAEQKEEAVGNIVVSGSWLALRGLGALGVEGAGAVAGPLSTALAITYLELKLMAQLYAQASISLTTGWLSLAFETMQDSLHSIAESATMLADAGLLAEIEPDPQRRSDFRQVEQNWSLTTANEVDHFLERCEPKTYGPGVAYDPGAYPVLVEHFAPLMRFKGAKTPVSAAAAARAVLQAIGWTFAHSQEVMAETSGFALHTESQQGAD